MRQYTIDKILECNNALNEVYTSDIDIWLDGKVPINKCSELAKKLTEIRDAKNK